MDIYPAIDLYQGKAVRLYKGDYARMTVYSEAPPSVARDFAAAGARHIHLVDLEGAKSGKPENGCTISQSGKSCRIQHYIATGKKPRLFVRHNVQVQAKIRCYAAAVELNT